MSSDTEVLSIDEPHFAVRVYESSLRIDLNGGVKAEIEDALENKPVLKESIGKILAVFVPLHVPLSDIDSVQMDEKGKITIKLPRHRDVTIQLEPENARKLVNKLNQLDVVIQLEPENAKLVNTLDQMTPGEKEKARAQTFGDQKSQRIEKSERDYDREAMSYPGGTQSPMPPPPGVRRKEREAEKQEENR
jgi:hypothetical protein